MILLPKYHDIEIGRDKPLAVAGFGVGGEFRLVLRNSNGGVVQDTGWFPNLITDHGMIRFGTANWSAFLHIGSSATAPNFTNGSLFGWMAVGTASGITVPSTNSQSPNYTLSATIVKRFEAGVATGTIREVGISPLNINSDMVIRALVTPEVVKLIDQVLDVYYKFSVWRRLTDRTGSVSIGASSYNYTIRACNVDETFVVNTFLAFQPKPQNTYHNAWSGNIGAITAFPSGSASLCTSLTTPVSQGSGYTNFRVFWDLNDGNIGGIKSVNVADDFNFNAGFQIAFTPVIPKTAVDVMTLNFQMQWARR